MEIARIEHVSPGTMRQAASAAGITQGRKDGAIYWGYPTQFGHGWEEETETWEKANPASWDSPTCLPGTNKSDAMESAVQITVETLPGSNGGALRDSGVVTAEPPKDMQRR